MKTGIRIKAKFYWLQWILSVCSLKANINGVTHNIRWGVSNLNLEPGDYTIEVYFRYFFIPVQRSQINLSLDEGTVVDLKYHTSFFVFSTPPFEIVNTHTTATRQKTAPARKANTQPPPYIKKNNTTSGPPPMKKPQSTGSPQTPPPIRRKKEYFVEINEEQKGPFDLDKMKLLIEINQLNHESLIWEKSLIDWKSAREVPEINAFFN